MIDIKKVQSRLLDMAKEIHCILERNDIPYVITYGTLLGAVRHGGFIPWDDDFDIYLFDDSYSSAIEVLRKELPSDLFLEDEESEPLYFHGWAHIKDLYSSAECDLYPQDNLYKHHGLSIDLYKATKIPRDELNLFQKREIIHYYNRKYSKGLMDESDYHSKVEAVSAEIKKMESTLESKKERQLTPIYGFMSLDGDMFEIDEVFPLKKYKFADTEFWGPNQYDSFLKRCYGDYMQLPSIEHRKPHYSNVVFSNSNMY